MKKFINIFLAVLITLFSFPIGSVNVSAAEKVYDDIADGEYQIGVKALNTNSDEESGANGFLIKKAVLKVDGDNLTLETSYTKDFDMDYGINWTKIEGNGPKNQDENDQAFTYVFEIDEIKDAYPASMNYYVPSFGEGNPMGNPEIGHSVDYRLVLDQSDLDNLPAKEVVEEKPEQPEETEKPEEEKPTEPGEGSNEGETEKPEEEKPEPAPEERVVGELISEADADEVYTVNFDSDSRATKGQLENPTKLLVKGDKEYIQIPVNDRGAPLFRSLKFNGEEVTWNSITEGPYTIQYELVDGIEGNIDVSMVIQAGPNAMPHDNIELWFDKDSLEVVKEAEEPTEEPEENDLVKYSIDYVIKHATKDETSAADSFFKKPGTLIERDGKTFLQTTINSWNMVKDITYADKKAKVISESKENNSALVEFEIKDDLSKAINLEMTVEVPGLYKQDHKARLVMDASSKELIEGDSGQGGQGGTPTPPPRKSDGKVEDKDNPKSKKDESNKVKADKVSKIDYVVYQADKDEVSSADSFFQKPAILLEKDGKQYLQFTVTSWSMVNWLKANGNNVLVIDEDKAKDSATVQIEIKGALSEAIALQMKITVPGLYEKEHDARLVLDPSSIVELDGEEAEKYLIHTDVAKPGDFGSNGNGDNDNENGDKKFGKNGNPKTGDTSQIFFFASLLMASLAVLVLQLRRRLAA